MGNSASQTGDAVPPKAVLNPERPLGSKDAFEIFEVCWRLFFFSLLCLFWNSPVSRIIFLKIQNASGGMMPSASSRFLSPLFSSLLSRMFQQKNQDLAAALQIEYSPEQADQLFDDCTSPDDRFMCFLSFKKMIGKAHEAIEKANLAEQHATTIRQPEKRHGKIPRWEKRKGEKEKRGSHKRGSERGPRERVSFFFLSFVIFSYFQTESIPNYVFYAWRSL